MKTPIEIVRQFLGKLGHPPSSDKSEYQVAFALNRLTQIVKELEEQSRDEGNQDRAKVICELADLLHAAYIVAAILGVPFHSAQWSAHRAHTPGRGRGLLNHAMSDFDDVKFMLPGGESDLEPEMQEEDTGQSSPRINETDLQIVLCGLLIKKKILAFVPQGEDQVDSATFVVTDQGELFMRENPSWRDVSEAYVKRHRQ